MQSISNITARYAETDKMGIIHHSVYPIWFEVGRSDYLNQIGTKYSTMENIGVMTPLVNLDCKFISPTYYEDRVFVITTVSKLSFAKITFNYEVKNREDNKTLVVGSTTHGFVDSKTFRPINLKKTLPLLYKKLSDNM